jgi:hypothetical protein
LIRRRTRPFLAERRGHRLSRRRDALEAAMKSFLPGLTQQRGKMAFAVATERGGAPVPVEGSAPAPNKR